MKSTFFLEAGSGISRWTVEKIGKMGASPPSTSSRLPPPHFSSIFFGGKNRFRGVVGEGRVGYLSAPPPFPLFPLLLLTIIAAINRRLPLRLNKNGIAAKMRSYKIIKWIFLRNGTKLPVTKKTNLIHIWIALMFSTIVVWHIASLQKLSNIYF